MFGCDYFCCLVIAKSNQIPVFLLRNWLFFLNYDDGLLEGKCWDPDDKGDQNLSAEQKAHFLVNCCPDISHP